MVGVNDLSEAEEKFWRGAVISEEFLSVCSPEIVAEVFSDKFDPASWDMLAGGEMPREGMRREIESMVSCNGGSGSDDW